jgi:hypothetical protein
MFVLFVILILVIGLTGKHGKNLGHPFDELFKRK